MDLGDIGEKLLPFVMVIVFIVFQFFLKRRRPVETTPLAVVLSLLSEVKQNQQLAEAFRFQWQAKNFTTASWQRNKNKLDFLDQSLQVALSDTFMMVEDFNRQIKSAKKYKSTSYMASINMEKLKELLARSGWGLEQWLSSVGATKETQTKQRSLFDSLFGSRR